MPKISSTKDLIMLLLYAKGHTNKLHEPIQGRTRLMKMIFLFEKEIRNKFNLDKKISEDALPEFKPYDYGPYSDKVYTDLEFLIDTGFVNVKKLGEVEENEEEMLEYQYWQANMSTEDEYKASVGIDEFKLTERGKGFVEKELNDISQEQWNIVNLFKARCTGIPLKTLLRYVYANYPAMTSKSKIRNEVMS